MMVERQILEERAGLYRLLGRLFEYPLTVDVLTAVTQLSLSPDSPLADGLTQMQAYLAKTGVSEAMTDALNVEMTRLLEGPGKPAAPPYASFYLHDGQLMGPTAQAARQAYLDWNVWPGSDKLLPDDHLAFELGFLAYLAQQAATPAAAEMYVALNASQIFIEQHIKPWLHRFCADLAMAAQLAFFVGLARLTQTAVSADLAWLSTIEEMTTADAVFAGS